MSATKEALLEFEIQADTALEALDAATLEAMMLTNMAWHNSIIRPDWAPSEEWLADLERQISALEHAAKELKAARRCLGA